MMTTAGETTAPTPVVTRLEKRWVIRMVLIAVAFGGFALAGLYDATIRYPARGRKAADDYLLDTLRMKLDKATFLTAQVGTSDPRAEFDRLSERVKSGTATDFDVARYRWLEQLRFIGELDPAHTAISSPMAKRQDLEAAAAAAPPGQKADPLTAWDLPVQWFIFVSCGAVATWVTVLLLRVWARKYSWDPASLRLGLPGGHALTPPDIRDFDKRKWHKFIVFVNVRPEHPTLGGKSVKLDLYCHTNLESWVLEMEKAAGPPAEAAAPETGATA